MVQRVVKGTVQISVTGISSNRSGFTLLELLVVLVILGTVTALVLPRVASFGDQDSRLSARNTATLLRYLGERSISSRTIYRLTIDLDQQTMQVEQKNGLGEYLRPEDPFLSRNPLQGKARLTDIRTGRNGTVSNGKVSVIYGTAGLSEPLLVHIDLPGKDGFTVQALPVNGSVRVAEGRLEVIR